MAWFYHELYKLYAGSFREDKIKADHPTVLKMGRRPRSALKTLIQIVFVLVFFSKDLRSSAFFSVQNKVPGG
jgi:hypothetical protein